MSAFLPKRARAPGPEPAHPTLEGRELTQEERRWDREVRAGHWRARAVAEAVFGSVSRSALRGPTGRRFPAALLQLDVPFERIEEHRRREDVFLSAVANDPLLATMPFIYVIGPAV